MADLHPTAPRMTFGTFLEWTRTAEAKHEYVDGLPVATPGITEAHNTIQGNLLALALTRLRGGPCRPFTSDMLIKTGNGRGRCPDVTIDCGPRNRANLVAPQPVVVFEVLSPETQREDRTLKLADYNATPSIAHYVLVETSQPLVHVYSRGPHGDFLLRPQEVRGQEGSVELPAVSLSLAIGEIYEGLATTFTD